MISVIIPAYNEEKYIISCLQAIFSQKEAPDFEVIVVDNKSRDRTAEIVKTRFPQVRLVEEPQRMVTIVRNRGAKEASGDILLFLDADVIMPSSHLREVKDHLDKDEKIVAVSGPYRYFDGSFYIGVIAFICYQAFVFPAEIIFNRLLGLGCSINAGNVAIRSHAFKKIGGFNEKIVFYGDEADIGKRLKGLGKVRFFYDLGVKSSARRLKKEGAVKSYLRYALNAVWPYLFGRPFNWHYSEVR
jgi:GT2 family glycosyltransferase